MGDLAADSFRTMGQIGSENVHVLVDGGSVHNFVQDTMADTVGLTLDLITPFRVLVGNGQELQCTQVCHGVPLTFQNHTFLVDLFILGLRGTNLVRGA